MAVWRQVVVALALVAGTGLAWALYVPSAAPILARIGLPGAAPAEPEAPGGPGGGFGGGGPALVVGDTVGEGRANARVSAIGDGRSRHSVAVTPLDAGRLETLEVTSGSEVVAGQVIGRLDSDIEALEVERAALVVADAEVTYARVVELQDRGASTDVALSEARLALESARLEQRDANLALERRTITAPISGVVGLLPVERGQQVDTGTVISTIEDRTSLLVEFRVPERFAGALEVGGAVTAVPLARPDLTLQGTIAALDNRIDLENRTLRVQAELPNADDRLRAGMAFSIEIRLPGDPFPEIAALAIQWGADGAFVWVERDGKAARMPVRIVQRNAERVLVAADLVPGERIVAEGVQRLREGAALRFVGDPPPPEAATPGEAGALGLTRAEPTVSGG